MEKGSFHPSRVEQADELVRRIPLPNQLPKGLDFSDIPATALKSSTLEGLISQNEDLMARLSVTLRKTNQLEETLNAFEKENSTLRHKFETIREQLLIFQEKDQRAGQRVEGLRNENSDLKATLPKLEKLYADLFVQAQSFQHRLVHLERYRKRIQKASASVQARAKLVPLLEKRMSEMAMNHTQALSAHANTIGGYEAKIADVRSEIEILRSKADDRDQFFGEKVKLENQLVFEQRQFKTSREDTQHHIDQMESETSHLRIQLKQALVTQDGDRRELEKQRAELPELHKEERNLREQIESLQVLWSQKQRELDQSEEKNRALQKLNQSISLNLNEQRKEIQGLKYELEGADFKAKDMIKKLIAEVQQLRRTMIDEGISLPE